MKDEDKAFEEEEMKRGQYDFVEDLSFGLQIQTTNIRAMYKAKFGSRPNEKVLEAISDKFIDLLFN